MFEEFQKILAPRIHEYLFYGEKCGKEIANRLYSLISVKNYLREHPEIDYREMSFAVYDYLNIFVAFDKISLLMNLRKRKKIDKGKGRKIKNVK